MLDQVEGRLERAEQQTIKRTEQALTRAAAGHVGGCCGGAACYGCYGGAGCCGQGVVVVHPIVGVPVPVQMKRMVNPVPGTWAYKTYGSGAHTVELLQWQLGWLEEAHKRLKRARAAALERPLPSAFVTFRWAIDFWVDFWQRA
jgi:hypothetical protein